MINFHIDTFMQAIVFEYYASTGPKSCRSHLGLVNSRMQVFEQFL